jgi:hypothetical protein
MAKKPTKPTTPPIARKVVSTLLSVQAGKVVDLAAWRKGLAEAKEHEAVCPSGYPGTAGELWLARVAPPLTPGSESVVLTTPYLILRPDVAVWREYLARTLPKTGLTDPTRAYHHLMKHGLDERYWAEYVFESYVNHREEVIFVRGLPDLPESRPHSRVNRDQD